MSRTEQDQATGTGFKLRNIGLAVQRRMAAKFDGDAERFRAESVKKLTRTLDVRR